MRTNNDLFNFLKKESRDFEKSICDFPKSLGVSAKTTYNCFLDDGITALEVGADVDEVWTKDGLVTVIPHIPINKTLKILGKNLAKVKHYNGETGKVRCVLEFS